MQTTNSQNEPYIDFTPVDFDPNAQEIRLEPRDEPYMGTVADVKVQKTRPDKGAYPMLILEWETEEGTIADFVVFYPNGAKNSGMGREKYLQLCTMFNLDENIVPQRLTSKDDFSPFIEAVRGQSAEFWVGANKDPQRQPNVYYTAPRSARANDDETPAQTPKKASAKKPAAATATKKPARR